MVGVVCDFGGPDHTAVTTAEAIVHVCELCSAIACSGCFTG